MPDHRQVFHRELEAIEAQVIELFGMVAEDLPVATDALLTGNSEAVRTLAERDQAIDDLYPRIEELADRQLVLQQPLASDLRFLISVLRVVPELERSHDLVVNIAHRASHILSYDLSPRGRGSSSRWAISPPTAAGRPWLPGAGPAVAVHPDTVLTTPSPA